MPSLEELPPSSEEMTRARRLDLHGLELHVTPFEVDDRRSNCLCLAPGASAGNSTITILDLQQSQVGLTQ